MKCYICGKEKEFFELEFIFRYYVCSKHEKQIIAFVESLKNEEKKKKKHEETLKISLEGIPIE